MSRLRWRREVFNSNILFGERRDRSEKNHAKKVTHPVTVPDDETSKELIETAATSEASACSSSSTPPPIHFGPVSSCQFQPRHPITHLTYLVNGGNRLVFSDEVGHIFIHDSDEEVVCPLIIPTYLQPSHETPVSNSINSSPYSMDIEDASSVAADSYERAFREEMLKKKMRPFCSSQSILDLKVNVEFHWTTPVESVEDAKGQICIQTIDLIHAHSITRIGFFASESFWSKGWTIPQVIHINTILTLPTSVTIASCEFFPGLPRGPYVEVGPLIFTRHGSSHIYLARPNSTRPPTILVHAKDFRTLMPPTTSNCRIDPDSPPLLCRDQWTWTQVEGSAGQHPLLAMFNGYVFRIGFNPITLSMTELDLVIGNSPHHPPTILAPFFRRNAHEYCLQELNRDIFILDRVEGSVSQFSMDGELRQCIEPSPPSDLTYRTPFQGFVAFGSYGLPLDIYLIDAFGAAIYRWTADHFNQRQYDLDGYPAKSTPTLRMKRPKPLRSAIILPPTVITPAVPLVYHAADGWVPYQPPVTRALTRVTHAVGSQLRRLVDQCTSDTEYLWTHRWSLDAHSRFWFNWLLTPVAIGYLLRLGYVIIRDHRLDHCDQWLVCKYQ